MLQLTFGYRLVNFDMACRYRLESKWIFKSPISDFIIRYDLYSVYLFPFINKDRVALSFKIQVPFIYLSLRFTGFMEMIKPYRFQESVTLNKHFQY